MRVFENRVLRRTFGPPKWDKVTGGWRKLHEEIRDLYSSTDLIRMIRQRKNGMGGTCSTN
jgi:hypothetical protein